MYEFNKMKFKYYKICKLYDKNAVVCNELEGMYYCDATRPAGCYRENEKKEKTQTKHKTNLK